jgi:hypothetical protein
MGNAVPSGSPLAAPEGLLGSPRRPEWFDPAIKTVLDGAEVLASARGPRELEQLTAELLGAELYRAVHEERRGLRFDLWLGELITATAVRVREGAESAYLLLHGLASVATPGLSSVALAERDQLRRLMGGRGLPAWLTDLPKIAATGEVHRMRDTHGTRFAVIAGFAYSGETDRSVFLFDIDASGFVRLAGAGVYDDLDQAAGAWCARTGSQASPQLVTDPQQLLCLVHCDIGEDEPIMGDESRSVLDNWFRAQRRIHDLAEALRQKGMPLPAPESLYHDLDTTPMVEQFSEWYAAGHGTRPDPEAVDALADEWMSGTLPETWFSVSPRRVEYQLELINDWIPDAVTIEVKALLPEWVRWLSER